MRRVVVLFLAAAALPAQTPAPKLSLDANGSVELVLHRGWPLFVDGLLWHSLRARKEAAPPLVVGPASGDWADSVRIVIAGPDGKEALWPLERLGGPEPGALTLPKSGRVPMAWRLDAARTAELEPGVYALAAVIEVGGGSGWNGRAVSAPVTITVADAPAELSEQQAAELALLRAREASVLGEPARAAGILLQELSRSPANVTLAAAAAASLEAAGTDELALAVAEAALDAFRAKAEAAVLPPAGLVALRDRLARKLFAVRP
ncbi:MAG: hypothetical protein Q8N47_27910 [Bryobacterales bacterium]|nr:hypothetical protein [Bryobacterales bacterium]